MPLAAAFFFIFIRYDVFADDAVMLLILRHCYVSLFSFSL